MSYSNNIFTKRVKEIVSTPVRKHNEGETNRYTLQYVIVASLHVFHRARKTSPWALG